MHQLLVRMHILNKKKEKKDEIGIYLLKPKTTTSCAFFRWNGLASCKWYICPHIQIFYSNVQNLEWCIWENILKWTMNFIFAVCEIALVIWVITNIILISGLPSVWRSGPFKWGTWREGNRSSSPLPGYLQRTFG